MHIAFEGLFIQPVQFLHFGKHPERAGGEHLRLSAGEHGGTVYAGQDARLAPDGADILQPAAVGADTLVEDLRADFFFREIIQAVFDLARLVGIYVRKMREDVLFDLVLLLFAGAAVILFERGVEFGRSVSADGSVDVFGNVIQLHLPLRLADLFLNALDERALLFDLLMPEEDGLHHLFVGDLLRARLDHHDGVLRARKPEA